MLKYCLGESLPKGDYKVQIKEKTFMQAVCNGHAFAFDKENITAKSDGSWTVFFDNGEKVWECNANYANANFIFSKP
jgi:hypothetical protein